MPMQSFVNPLPGLNVRHLLQFDFPADYCAANTKPNINIAPPGIEEMYGKLGTPPKEQAHPFMREWPKPEPEDPSIPPLQDQTVDIDRKVEISHTARLSGTFVKYIANSPYHSVVDFYAIPIAPGSGSPISLFHKEQALTPMSNAPNVWYWAPPNSRTELLYTAQVIFDPKQARLVSEQVYKLLCKWAFWDHSGTSKERMPISGFDEAVTFEVIQRTEDM
jgi:hypothetical protein